MRYSTNTGSSEPLIFVGSTARPRSPLTGTVPFATESPVSLWSLLVGVGHIIRSTAFTCAVKPLKQWSPLSAFRFTKVPEFSPLLFALGVCHITCALRCNPPLLSPAFGPPWFASVADGVCKYPQPLSSVWGTAIISSEHHPSCIIPCFVKVTKDGSEISRAKEPPHVLQERESG